MIGKLLNIRRINNDSFTIQRGRGAAQWGLGPTACSSIAAAGSLSSPFLPSRGVPGTALLLNFSLFKLVLIYSSYMNVNCLRRLFQVGQKWQPVSVRASFSGSYMSFNGKSLIIYGKNLMFQKA